ncbi:MAG: hypothetical protein RJA69_1958 [Pseudomonadota bacterium]|jgi:signal transduction histidine kinase
MNDILSFLAGTPYSIPQVLGLVLFFEAYFFLVVHRRARYRYSLWLAVGVFLLGIAWFTTAYQNVGKLHVDWGWWWAQPFFALGIAAMGVGVIKYLPLPARWESWLLILNVACPLIYVLVGTVALLLDIALMRSYIIWLQLPPFFALSAGAFLAGRFEPGKGHLQIGFLILFVPALSILYPLLGLNTAVLRIWTGIPLIVLGLSILTVSLLREREKVDDNLARVQEGERRLAVLNQELESRVKQRTAMLRDMITDLEAFNRSVSHDIRSPLGSIALTAALAKRYLQMGEKDQTLAEIESIEKQLAETQNLVTTMLKIAGFTENPSRQVPIDLEKLAQEQIDKVLNFIRAGDNPSFHPQFVVSRMPQVSSDPDLLAVIFDNLLENAIKYNQGQTDLRIEIGSVQIQDRTCVYVRDNGVGISDDLELTIFKPFVRSAGEHDISGFGLGLNIVKRAVNKLGGDIWFESNEHSGVTFYFSLPTGLN